VTKIQGKRKLEIEMASNLTSKSLNGSADIDGLTLANIDLANRKLVARLRERDLQAAGVRIKAAVRRLQDLGIIDSQGRRLNKELPPDMKEESNTDFGG
jgi:hypothetical protein